MAYISDSEEFQKKKDFLIRRNQGKFLSGKCQEELKWLFPGCYSDCRILDLSESDALINTVRNMPKNYEPLKIYTAFDNKALLRDVITQLYEHYPNEVYFVGDYADTCGVVAIPSINCFDADFPCTFEYSEIFGFWTVDLKNFLLVDFGEEDGELYVELEIEGEKWNGENITARE